MKKTKILIVEDEPIIALNLQETLEELDYETFGITNNRCRTLELLKDQESPDLILMDIYLQGPTTGIQLAKEDYSKDVDFESLKNINKTLEHKLTLNEESKSRTIKLKYGYLFDKEKEILYYGDEVVKLTNKETDIIKALCKTPGQKISQEQLEYAIWQNEPAGYAAFRSVLFRLRNKIHKDLITNQNNTGYRIELL